MSFLSCKRSNFSTKTKKMLNVMSCHVEDKDEDGSRGKGKGGRRAEGGKERVREQESVMGERVKSVGRVVGGE
jgi:hypothetical protein